MNWGYKIALVIVLFVVAMLSMVTIAMRQTNDMVDEKYYDKEMAYQGLMAATENLNKSTTLSLLSQTDSTCLLTLPAATYSPQTVGTVEFLRLSDKRADLNAPLQVDAAGKQIVSKQKLLNGMYKLRIKWETAATPYYKEETVFITKK